MFLPAEQALAVDDLDLDAVLVGAADGVPGIGAPSSCLEEWLIQTHRPLPNRHQLKKKSRTIREQEAVASWYE
jgi:hypothetical protein